MIQKYGSLLALALAVVALTYGPAKADGMIGEAPLPQVDNTKICAVLQMRYAENTAKLEAFGQKWMILVGLPGDDPHGSLEDYVRSLEVQVKAIGFALERMGCTHVSLFKEADRLISEEARKVERRP